MQTVKIIAACMAIIVMGIIIALLIGIRGALFPFTEPFKTDDGSVIENAISELTVVELGGMEQYILLRGGDPSNPVLLWLHGGPGGAQMPLTHALDSDLEQKFVVAHWDQRGAGKSNHSGFDEKTMTFDQFLSDAHELVQYLKQRFHQDKIFLLGHSWGTQLGIELSKNYPEDFHAFISVSQVVNHERATEIAHQWLQETIKPDENPDDFRLLNEIDIPASKHAKFRKLNRLTDKYGGSFDVSLTRLARIAARAPEYNLRDYKRLLNGMNRGGGPMHRDGIMGGFNYMEEIPAIDTPVYFLIGKKDYNTPYKLVKEYFNLLEAPQKDLILFEQSAHTPFLAEPEKFSSTIINIKHQIFQNEQGENNYEQ
jgi:pimeloyl-ACP methyl ester carboxylesterase